MCRPIKAFGSQLTEGETNFEELLDTPFDDCFESFSEGFLSGRKGDRVGNRSVMKIAEGGNHLGRRKLPAHRAGGKNPFSLPTSKADFGLLNNNSSIHGKPKDLNGKDL
jgi:hypothetical protein